MAHFQKDGLWVQGGLGSLSLVSETTPFVPGQLGRVMSIRGESQSSQADTKVPRFYQYVQRYTTDSETTVLGAPAYWVDLDDFIVSAEQTDAFGGTTNPTVAGVFLGAYPAAGKYGFIQVGGIAEVSVTDTVVAGARLEVGDNDQFKTLAAITITSQAVSVAVNGQAIAIAVDAVETSTNSVITAILSVVHNGW